MTISFPSGSAIRQQSFVSSRSRPPDATIPGHARLSEIRRDSELEMNAVSLLAPPGVRLIKLLKHQHRVQPPLIVEVGDPGSTVWGVFECGDPERADRGHIGRVQKELSKTRQRRIRGDPEPSRDGLKVAGEVGVNIGGTSVRECKRRPWITNNHQSLR